MTGHEDVRAVETAPQQVTFDQTGCIRTSKFVTRNAHARLRVSMQAWHNHHFAIKRILKTADEHPMFANNLACLSRIDH